jgi:glycosyltransferase involved in cell wall biosynthesis
VGKPKLNVVLPAYNEAGNLEPVVSGLLAVAPELEADLWVTIVDDGSTDSTAVVISNLQKIRPNILCVAHSRNIGYGGAVISGMKAVEADYIAIMDADGQFDARDLVTLFRHTRSHDVVVGYRRKRADPLGRRFLGRLWTILGRCIFRIPVRDLNCGLKILKRSLIDPNGLQCEGPGVNMEIMSKITAAGIPIQEVGCRHFSRRLGRQSGASFPVVKRGIAELFRMMRGKRV